MADRAHALRTALRRHPPPRPDPSEPPPALARTLPPQQPQAAVHLPPGRTVEAPKPASSRSAKVLIAIALAGVVIVAFLKTGGGKVFTATAGHWGEPLAGAVTIVDGQQHCTGARCSFEVGPGVHEVAVRADGYVPQFQLVAVQPREPSAVNFRLERGGSSVKVSGQPEGTSLVLDGERAGKLPLQLDLTPGTHRLRFEAEHFVPEERTLEVTLGETKLTDVVLLPVLGKARFDVRTPGAELALVSGSERKDHLDPSQPVDVDLSRKWSLEAKKDGYQFFRVPLEWNDGLEKTFVVTLEKAPWHPPPRKGAWTGGGAPRSPAPTANSPDALRAAMQHAIERDVAKPSAAVEEDLPPSPERGPIANEPCRVSFNSIPASTVYVDNARVGVTPILKTPVKPGTHVAQFVEGDTKKIKMFVCKPGEMKIVAVSLNR